MSKQTRRDGGGPTFLGRHTVAAYLQNRDLKDLPTFLRLNDRKLPPNIICVGDRRRAEIAATDLEEAGNLRDVVRLDLDAKDHFGLEDSGRVTLYLGTYGPSAKPLPIVIVETQMGPSATQIIMKEVLALVAPKGKYILDDGGTNVEHDRIRVIRVGTCGAINDTDGITEPIIKVGDVGVTTQVFGYNGAIAQSTGDVSLVDPPSANDAFAYTVAMRRLGYTEGPGGSLYSLCSPAMTEHLVQAAKNLDMPDISVFKGSTLTKDSLDAEDAATDKFLALRRSHGIVTTEMEISVINFLAAQFAQYGITVETGLIGCVLGVLPESFTDSPESWAKIRTAEVGILTVAAQTLNDLAYGAAP